jgi:hypothetical protein
LSESKKCNICETTKPLSAFAKGKYAPGGYRYGCKACENARQKLKRAAVAELIRADRTKKATPPPPEADFEITWEAYTQAMYPTSTLPPTGAVATATPTPALEVEAPKTVLETAYEEHRSAKEKRDIRKEHGALIEENDRLRRELAETRVALRPPEIVVYRQPSWERSDAIACAIASDWHVEETVNAESVHGLNEYNLDVARSRAEHFFKNWLRLTDIMARDTKITTMFLAGLGDFFSGWIHEELLASTSLAPGDAARFVKGLFCSGIDYLLRESPYTLEGVLIPGNHGRMTKYVHMADPTGTSLESVMYDAVRDRYHGNPRVRLEVSEHAMRYRRFYERMDVRFIHGYEVKFGGGVGGLTIPLRKALSQWNIAKRADLTLLGHFHQLLDGGDFIVNGSLIGYNTFAQGIKASFEEPRQSFFLITARKGGQKSVTAPIWLDSAHHAHDLAVAP